MNTANAQTQYDGAIIDVLTGTREILISTQNGPEKFKYSSSTTVVQSDDDDAPRINISKESVGYAVVFQISSDKSLIKMMLLAS